ncbi:hypothetical protein [Bacillus massiliigorillae]|uniref:hypothetical protein n=1 Tax=Bacillus massiliigorillae TaxID=1243664 RepID=UPI0003A00320|nr:hypothetical protein [Bacillus massiliigorillae]
MVKILLITIAIIYVVYVATEIGVSLFINKGREKEKKVKKEWAFPKWFKRVKTHNAS